MTPRQRKKASDTVTCFHPLKAFTIGVTESGKKKLKVVSFGVDHLELVERPGKGQLIIPVDVPYDLEHRSPYALRIYKEYVQIPCGHCIGCRLEYSKQWANRMTLESLDHDSNLFITLTYSDEYLESHCRREYSSNADNISSVTRINGVSYSLNKRDFQLFMKRLRKRFPDQKIRFYACGEYGSKSLRPHFHACVFGLKLPDLVEYRRSHHGYPLYNSQVLSELWPFGFAVVSDFSWQTAAYVARYVTKKRSGDNAQFYETFNLEPEFSLMSRKPGLARRYYDENKDKIYESGEIILSELQAGKHMKFRPPHYYDTLYDVEDPIRMEEIKTNLRKIAENSIALQLSKTSLSYLEYLAVREYNLVHKTKSLKRSDC